VSEAVLVAGGTGALGAAVVEELLAAGRPVTATWVVPDEAARVERDLGGRGELHLVEADLTDPEVVRAVVAGVEGLGAVVDLVGGYAGGTKVDETDVETLDRMLALNVRPLFLLAREALPRLVGAGGGSLVGVSARAALRPFSGAASYIAAKAAVLALVQALDAEWKASGVRCNAIVPNVIDTPANRRAMPDADTSAWTPPAEVARVVRFLVSDESAAVSGAAVPV
jgi:NAD(P)-dependent dehydrogenase (short-subunit alcohol dehydrogenase family)